MKLGNPTLTQQQGGSAKLIQVGKDAGKEQLRILAGESMVGLCRGQRVGLTRTYGSEIKSGSCDLVSQPGVCTRSISAPENHWRVIKKGMFDRAENNLSKNFTASLFT